MNVPISPKIEVSSSSQEPIKKVIYDEKTGFLRFGDKVYTVKVFNDAQPLKLSEESTKKIAELVAQILNQQALEQIQSMPDLNGVTITNEKIGLAHNQPDVKLKNDRTYKRIQEIVHRSLPLPAESSGSAKSLKNTEEKVTEEVEKTEQFLRGMLKPYADLFLEDGVPFIDYAVNYIKNLPPKEYKPSDISEIVDALFENNKICRLVKKSDSSG